MPPTRLSRMRCLRAAFQRPAVVDGATVAGLLQVPAAPAVAGAFDFDDVALGKGGLTGDVVPDRFAGADGVKIRRRNQPLHDQLPVGAVQSRTALAAAGAALPAGLSPRDAVICVWRG